MNDHPEYLSTLEAASLWASAPARLSASASVATAALLQVRPPSELHANRSGRVGKQPAAAVHIRLWNRLRE